MGLFDAFKKKVKETSEEVNPLYNKVKEADLGIENLQVANSHGNVTVTGSIQNEENIEKVNEILKSSGVSTINNKLAVVDLSHLGIFYRVDTKSSNLNCRKGPGTDHEIVGKFAKDSEVQLLKKYNAVWHMVKKEDVVGYCHTDYLKLIRE